MATVDFNSLKSGTLIAIHYVRDSQNDDICIAGEITRIDKDSYQLCIDGFTYRNNRIERYEIWFMDYAYVRESKLITPEQYQELEKNHRKDRLDLIKSMLL